MAERKEEILKNQTTVEVAEEAREKEWKYPSFIGELFLGNTRWDLILPYPEQSEADRRIGDEICAKVAAFLKKNLDPDALDRTGELPRHVIDGLAQLGCFGMKIPKEYGGLHLSQVNYNRVVHLVASYCASTAVWLSAHQSIGVPQPLILFGTEEQKRKYLPRFAKGEISAFALTEPEVGSDPANMITTAVPTADGNHYILNGEKLWCTNGPVASVIAVMAQTPPKIVKGREKKQITAFIVETSWEGVESAHRCHFMGLHGIQNGLLRFKNVKVPKENILLGLGQGLKLALITLNTGRLTMPAAVTAGAKWCLGVTRKWANERNQWGAPVGHHEAIAAKIAQMTSTTFAMESVTWLSAAFADKKNFDIRLEAATAKLFCTEASWHIIDATVQIRGGRGYETSDSLKARGEEGIPVERVMRDSRINTIIEGTSQIMRLFIAREALDPHARNILPLLSKDIGISGKLKLVWNLILFYVLWYPKQWFYGLVAKEQGYIPKELRPHVSFVNRSSHRVARNLFHAMMLYQQGLEKKQRLLGRIVNIGTDLFAMAASCSRAALLVSKNPSDKSSVELADLFCRDAKKRVNSHFQTLFKNSDATAYRIARNALEGKYNWLEDGIIPPH
ncbi:MAG: acyl-CoA dehydrogenase family protein [Candidatus Omnitrophica bacterium]|nr:acyl-CoA dehydrogenase family protein [Candidatus Omnitrophota bacterium]